MNPVDDPTLGLPEDQRPTAELVGTDGNVFSIIGRVSAALRKAKEPAKAQEWVQAAGRCPDYDSVLQLLFRYVDPT